MNRSRRFGAKRGLHKATLEYRDALRAELAKLEAHLNIAENLSAPSQRNQLESWLSNAIEPPEQLH